MIKLLKLETLNLASLQGENVIDFEQAPLKGCTIFSIVGSTGSGKSTLLDAICLALYGNTPRYTHKKNAKDRIEIIGEADEGERNRLAPTDPRNILTRGERLGHSKVTFAANNGAVYRAEWHVAFKRVNYDEARTYLYRLTGTHEEECPRDTLPRILGLDMEQFLRTVVIAQGSFASFLKASEEERYGLLEKLVGNGELYKHIADKVWEERNNAEEQLTNIKSQCKAQEAYMLTDEEVAELTQLISTLEAQEKKNKEESERVKKALEWYDEEERQQKALKNYRQQLEKARAATQQLLPQEQRLKMHDATLPAADILKAYLDARNVVRANRKRGEELASLLNAKREELKKKKEGLDQLKQEATRKNEALTKAEPHIKEARRLKTLMESDTKLLERKKQEVDELNEKARQAKEALEKHQKAIEEATKTHKIKQEAHEKATKEADDERTRLKSQLDKADKALAEAQEKLKGRDGKALQAAVNTAQKNCADIEKAINTLSQLSKTETELQQKRKQRQELTDRNSSIAAELERLDIDALEKAYEQQKELYTLVHSTEWASYRHHLREGKACPLCGATDHPFASNEAPFAQLQQKTDRLLKEKAEELRTTKAKKNACDNELATNNGILKTLEGENGTIATLEKEVARLQKEWQELLNAHNDWEGEMEKLVERQKKMAEEEAKAKKELTALNDDTEAANGLQQSWNKAVELLNRQAEKSKAALEKSQKEMTDSHTKVETLKGQTNQMVATAEERQENLQEARGQSETMQAELQKKQSAFDEELHGEDPDQVEKRLKDEKEKAEKGVEDENATIASMEKAIGGLDGEKKNTEEQLREYEKKQGKEEKKLREWLAAYNSHLPKGDAPLAGKDILEMVNANDDWEKLREDITQKKNAEIRCRTTFQNANEALDKHHGNKPLEEKETLAQRQQELTDGEGNDELVRQKTRMGAHLNATKELGTLANQRQTAEEAFDEWKRVADALGGKEGKTVRKIAQCYTLRFLVAQANEEIKRFDTRYELQQVRNSLGMRVIDHDRLDDVRDTTSLSGGETFIVSLGLALGLASLSSNNASFANLFIDEGFGTLDPEYLNTVINALSNMQSHQGKKVGVISHTESMAEGIGTRIRVEKESNTGRSHIVVE